MGHSAAARLQGAYTRLRVVPACVATLVHLQEKDSDGSAECSSAEMDGDPGAYLVTWQWPRGDEPSYFVQLPGTPRPRRAFALKSRQATWTAALLRQESRRCRCS